MGSIQRVCCPACGYQSDDLLGVGGDVGMAAQIISTVACPVSKTLEDTDAGRITADLMDRAWPEDEQQAESLPVGPSPCPKCGELHPLWDAEAAVCPRCETPGCQVESGALGLSSGARCPLPALSLSAIGRENGWRRLSW